MKVHGYKFDPPEGTNGVGGFGWCFDHVKAQQEARRHQEEHPDDTVTEFSVPIREVITDYLGEILY